MTGSQPRLADDPSERERMFFGVVSDRTETLKATSAILEEAFTRVSRLPGLSDPERSEWRRRAQLARHLPGPMHRQIH